MFKMMAAFQHQNNNRLSSILYFLCSFLVILANCDEELRSFRNDNIKQNKTGRIIGGQRAQEESWPFMAAILYDGHQYCGGSVWAADTIVTAAHCLFSGGMRLDAYYMEVILGNHNLRDIGGIESKYKYSVRRTIPHERYVDKSWFREPNSDPSAPPEPFGGSFRYDIAVLKLTRPIDLASEPDRVSCVCPPKPRAFLDTNRCVAMGWGRTNSTDENSNSQVLLEVELPLNEEKVCAKRSARFNSHWHICAGYFFGEKDACRGDSGGPFVCPLSSDTRTWTLVGITSFGEGCAEPDKPGYYTKVEFFEHWLNAKAAET